MNDEGELEFTTYPDEHPEVLEPEVEEFGEGEDTSLPIPSELDPLQAYLREANRFTLLTPEEEKSLATLYRETGDKDAGTRLITSNLRLVIKIALEFQKYWMKNLLDLIQEGNIGLMQAIKKFDP
ncbi:MAG: sigma-70 factor domain-containing protein, partial [Desulfobaccales bacterium]